MGAFSSPRLDHLVERQAEPVALAQAHPADARRQALEVDALARHVEPAVQVRVVGDQLLAPWRRCGGCPRDRPTAPPSGTGRCPGRTAAGCRPARSRGSRRRSSTPSSSATCADVVAVVEGREPGLWNASMASTCAAIEACARLHDGRGIARRAARPPLLERPAVRQVAVQRVVRAGLVGHQRRAGCRARTSSGSISAALPSRPTETRLACARGVVDDRAAPRRAVGRRVEVARARGACRCAPARHSTREQTPPAIVAASGCAPPMPPSPAVRIQLPGEVAAEVLAAPSRRRSRRCPARCPAMPM